MRCKESDRFRLSGFKLLKNIFLLIGLILALVSRGKSWDIPTDMISVSTKSQTEEIDTTVMCTAFKDGLLKTGLVVGLHASLPRDDSDYEMFSTSAEADGLFVSINEQRQFILYFGKASAG